MTKRLESIFQTSKKDLLNSTRRRAERDVLERDAAP